MKILKYPYGQAIINRCGVVKDCHLLSSYLAVNISLLLRSVYCNNLWEMADYGYITLRYTGQNVFLYHICKNVETRELSFEQVDGFVKDEEMMRGSVYLKINSNQVIVIENPSKLVAELVAVNDGPFMVFDNYNCDSRFISHGKEEIRHYTAFDILYDMDLFNMNGVVNVLQKHGFKPKTIKYPTHIIKHEKNWLKRKCRHQLKMCELEGECDPDCSHYKIA